MATKKLTKKLTPEERFWRHVEKRGPDECWPWTAVINHRRGGYGQCRFRLRYLRAHRVAYELARGPIGPRQVLRHSCDNPPCCNPAHLIPGDQMANVHDCIRSGRFARGTDMSHARLNPEKVRLVRGMSKLGISQVKIARELGVTAGCIQQCLERKSWAWVE